MFLLLAACTAEETSGPAPTRSAPPTARLATHREMVEDRAALRQPSDGGGSLHHRSGPRAVAASSPVELGFDLEVGPLGIAEGGAITLIPSPFWGWTSAQVSDPLGPGFTTVEAPAGVVLEPFEAEGQLQLRVRGRALSAGERVAFTYGVGGSARADRFAERGSGLWVAVDGDGDGVRQTLAEPLEVDVVAGPAAQLVATLPSTARREQAVELVVAVLDASGNAGVAFTGALTFERSDAIRLPTEVTLAADAGGRIRVPVQTLGEGVVRVAVAGPGGLATLSNPMVIRDDAPAILWGDLQVHTGRSDGTGVPVDVLGYARDVAALDVVALTDHDHWGMRFLDGAPEWVSEIALATERAHEDGAFVTVHGFEWTNWVVGHRHVLWFDGPGPVLSSLDPAYDTVGELRDGVRGRRALIVPHHPAGGPVAVDWSEPVDATLEPVVEICSVHGQSGSPDLPGAIYDAVPGAFVEQRLTAGARFGLIGSTDGHDGHPGLAHLVGGAGGLVAFEGASRTRTSVYETLRARRVYATNGPRIVLRTTTDAGATMGSDVPDDRPLTLDVRVIGTAPLARVELVRRSGIAASRAGTGTVFFERFPVEPIAGDAVWVRVVQVDGGLAWSSPLFFDDGVR